MTQQAQAEALLPCPFCGSEVDLKPSQYGDYSSVICLGNNPCEGQMSIVIPNDSLSSGIAAWNRRAQLEAQQAVPQAWKVTEEMHVAAVKVLQRANGLDGLPQRMLDAMLAAAPTPPAQEQLLSFEPKKQELTTQSEEHKPQCWCTTCRPITLSDMRFVVCPECGNKRCPRAHNHELACTASNDPGQKGSSWEHVQPRGRHGDQS